MGPSVDTSKGKGTVGVVGVAGRNCLAGCIISQSGHRPGGGEVRSLEKKENPCGDHGSGRGGDDERKKCGEQTDVCVRVVDHLDGVGEIPKKKISFDPVKTRSGGGRGDAETRGRLSATVLE